MEMKKVFVWLEGMADDWKTEGFVPADVTGGGWIMPGLPIESVRAIKDALVDPSTIIDIRDDGTLAVTDTNFDEDEPTVIEPEITEGKALYYFGTWIFYFADGEPAATELQKGATIDDLSRFNRKYPNLGFRIEFLDDGTGFELPRLTFISDGEAIIAPFGEDYDKQRVDPTERYSLARDDAEEMARINGAWEGK